MTVHVALTEGEFTLVPAIRIAARLAKRLNTPLIGVTAMPDPARAVMMTGVAMHGMMIATGGSLSDSIGQAQDDARKALEETFQKITAEEGLPENRALIEHHIGLPSEVFPRVSLLTDGLIHPHECVKLGNDHGLAFETTLIDRGQPVIAAGLDEDPKLDTVMIAWDGSPQAARAVRFHTGLLRASTRIMIAQNSDAIDNKDRDGSESPVIVERFLNGLGLAAELITFDGKVADGLLSLVKEHEVGVLIAGAYGHSRFEELIFGGVSRSLLRADDGPALALSH